MFEFYCANVRQVVHCENANVFSGLVSTYLTLTTVSLIVK